VSGPEIRPATAADLARFYGGRPIQFTHHAIMLVVDGEPLAIGGIIYQGLAGPPYLFSEIKPEAAPYGRALARGMRQLIAEFASPGMIAIADPELAGAARRLERLGFVYVTSSPHGAVYRFEGKPP
jgi:hypothetical protein